MSFYNEEEYPFVRRCESIVLDAKNNGKITLFKFLNKREIEILTSNAKDVYLYLDTYGIEYKRAVISAFELNPDFKISLIKIIYNKKYLAINHRMVLGALMSIGIERNTIGDIIITTNNDVYFYATKEITPYLFDEFKTLSNQAISLVETNEIIGEIKINYVTKKAFVNSLRLDLILAHGFNENRTIIQDLIKNGDCKINQKRINNTSHILKEGDIISLKGYGRLVLKEVGRLSKNNKIYVELAKMI
ncbi:MAG: YlmH/Sll1252 family protein [Anaeroplasma sp.]